MTPMELDQDWLLQLLDEPAPQDWLWDFLADEPTEDYTNQSNLPPNAASSREDR